MHCSDWMPCLEISNTVLQVSCALLWQDALWVFEGCGSAMQGHCAMLRLVVRVGGCTYRVADELCIALDGACLWRYLAL